MDNRPTHLDLFSGIGGFAIGFEQAGFRTMAFAETDPDASLVLAAHWPDVPNLGDVTKLCRSVCDCDYDEESGEACCPRCNTGQFTDTHGWPDVITGGVPCQPASALGHMRGADDERWLWSEVVRVVRELRPPFAVFENPPSVFVLPEFHGILGEFAALGYDLWWDVIPAAALGAGHLRERVFVVLADSENAGGRKPSQRQGRENTFRGGADSGRTPAARPTAANTDDEGLEGHAGNEHACLRGKWQPGPQPAGSVAAPTLCGRVNGADWWSEANTGIPVLAYGLSSRLVKAACKCAGNAVLPQVAAVLAETIRKHL